MRERCKKRSNNFVALLDHEAFSIAGAILGVAV
jgi:hypothetical protein